MPTAKQSERHDLITYKLLNIFCISEKKRHSSFKQKFAPLMNKNLSIPALLGVSFALLLGGCATESHQTIQPTEVSSVGTPYHGPKQLVSIGKFSNQSPYLRGLFSDGVDRLGSQAQVIFTGHLQQSGRFTVLDRTNLEETEQESALLGQEQKLQGAKFVLTGQVTEFGRKEVGDQQLYGVLGSGKKQIAYAKVVVNVIDVATSAIVYSAQGAGEYALSSREVIGFGGSASYDSTLNGKVLDLAIREAVDNLAKGVETKQWGAEQ